MNLRNGERVKGRMPRPFLHTALFILFAIASVPASARADTERVSHTVRLDPGGTLRLNNFSGRVTVTGSDRSDVRVDAVRRGTRTQLDRVRLEIRSDASTVHVNANTRDRWWFNWGRHNIVETDFEIRVPRRTNLDLTLFSASLDVQGVDGSHQVQTFSSRARLDDVNGSIRAKSFSGAIQIRATAGTTSQTITVETFSGGVDLRVPESAKGRVLFESFSGKLTAALPLTVNTSRRRELSGQLGSANEIGSRADTGRRSTPASSVRGARRPPLRYAAIATPTCRATGARRAAARRSSCSSAPTRPTRSPTCRPRRSSPPPDSRLVTS